MHLRSGLCEEGKTDSMEVVERWASSGPLRSSGYSASVNIFDIGDDGSMETNMIACFDAPAGVAATRSRSSCRARNQDRDWERDNLLWWQRKVGLNKMQRFCRQGQE
jgi:hypothetical protein